MVQDFERLWILDLEAILVPKVVALAYDLICLLQSHGREEVWQIFVHINVVSLEIEAHLR